MIVVEFKSTSTKPGESIQAGNWYMNNKLQVMFYAWLLAKNNKSVHHTGYLIYSDALRDGPELLPFNNRLYFKTVLAACLIDYALIEHILDNLIVCLLSEIAPDPKRIGKQSCIVCNFVKALSGNQGLTQRQLQQNI